MTSEKQIAANRQNAQRSTGPTTTEGKKASSLNALRHGLTGQVTAMTPEDRAAHDTFSAALIKDLAPEGALETQLAQRISTDSWRLNRLSAIEDNIYALGLQQHAGDASAHPQIDAAFSAASVFTQQAKTLQLLSLYDQRLNRSVLKNLAELKSLQASRNANREAELTEAAALLQLSEMKGLPYDAAQDKRPDGFVFSTAEIHAFIHRAQRLNHASNVDFSKFKPRKALTRAA